MPRDTISTVVMAAIEELSTLKYFFAVHVEGAVDTVLNKRQLTLSEDDRWEAVGRVSNFFRSRTMSDYHKGFDQPPGHAPEKVPNNLRRSLKRIDPEVRVGEYRRDEHALYVTLYNNEEYEMRFNAATESDLRKACKLYVHQVILAKKAEGK